MPKPRGAARLVAGGPGLSEVRNPPVVVTAPADFASATALAALKAYGRINTAGVDPTLEQHLRAAVSEAEALTWRALLRQTREQVFTPDDEGWAGEAGVSESSVTWAFAGGEARQEPTFLDEPYEPGSATAYELDRDGRETQPRITAELPSHGRLWIDWAGGAVARRIRYDAGWADYAAVPDDLKQAVFALAAASYARKPELGDGARNLLMTRYARRRRPAAVAVGDISGGGGYW